MWTIEPDDSDIGWDVTNGHKSFNTRSEADAQWLCDLLNTHSPQSSSGS